MFIESPFTIRSTGKDEKGGVPFSIFYHRDSGKWSVLHGRDLSFRESKEISQDINKGIGQFHREMTSHRLKGYESVRHKVYS